MILHTKINYKGYTNSVCIKTLDKIIVLAWNNSTYFILSFIDLKNIKFDTETHFVEKVSLDTNLQKIFKKINVKLFLSSRFFFTKIKLVGKGFRLQSFKKKNIINYSFGHSHIYVGFVQSLLYKRLTKYRYILYTNVKSILTSFRHRASVIKPLNLYTLRGLKLSKKIYIKRKGRKSPNL